MVLLLMKHFSRSMLAKSSSKVRLLFPRNRQLVLTMVTASIRCRKWAKDMYAVQGNGGGVAIGDVKSSQ